MLEDFTSRAKNPQHTPAFLFNPDCEGQTHRRREALRFDRGRACVRRPPTAETRHYSKRAVSTDMRGRFFVVAVRSQRLGAVRSLRRKPGGNRTNFPPSHLSYRGCVVPLVVPFQTLQASQSTRDGLKFFGVHSR